MAVVGVSDHGVAKIRTFASASQYKVSTKLSEYSIYYTSSDIISGALGVARRKIWSLKIFLKDSGFPTWES